MARALFVATWEKTAGAAWVARDALSPADYQAASTTYTSQGYRLISVSGYTDGGRERYAALWDKSAGVAWQARHHLTDAQYQATSDQMTHDGYRPRCISGFAVDGAAVFAALWDKSAGGAWVARHDLSAQQYQQLSTELHGQGYRLNWVTTYAPAGADLYAGVWEKRGGPAQADRHQLTEAAFQSADAGFAAQGYTLVCADACSVNGQDLYVGIWQQLGDSTTAVPVSHHGMTGPSFQSLFDHLVGGGYRLRFISGFDGSQPIDVVLPMTMQKQSEGDWCWAAVAASVAAYYDASTTWTQCRVANDQLGRTDCCGSGAGTACNVYGRLDLALQSVGHLDHWQDGTVAFSDVRAQLLQNRPLGIRVAWSGGGAHFVAATGCEEGDYVLVADPGTGTTSIVAYSTLTTSYQQAGTWTDSSFVKA